MSPSARKPKKSSPKTQPPRSAEPPRAEWETSQAEIRLAYTPAGRETLDAITNEVFAKGEERDRESAPEIQVGEEVAGRETLAAIAEELRPGVRDELDTLPYGDRISNAPGAKTPSKLPSKLRPGRARSETAPEITVRQVPAGRETLAAIEAELRGEDAASAPRSDAPTEAPPPEAQPGEPLEIFEMVTFVVRGSDAARLSTEALRRRFAEEQLMRRLPVSSAEDIDRVDVTPWTVRDTFVVRVWCKLKG